MDAKSRAAISLLEKQGYRVLRRALVTNRTVKVELPKVGQSYVFGVVSDTHFGSLTQALTPLHQFYKILVQRRIKLCFHCGDLVAGPSTMHRGMEFELFLHGATQQRDYAIQHYPAYGVQTKIIGGNHDYAWHKEAQINVPAEVCDKRSDMEFLGWYYATLKLSDSGLNVGLMHGDSGNAYARSYRLQKISEQISPKPNILLVGHYHTACILPQYRNIEAVQMPCFEWQTTWEKGKALYPTVAGLIVTVTPNKRGIARIVYEFVPFYIPTDKDY